MWYENPQRRQLGRLVQQLTQEKAEARRLNMEVPTANWFAPTASMTTCFARPYGTSVASTQAVSPAGSSH